MKLNNFDLHACISGSFKFKDEIDHLHDDFVDLGVGIIEPTKGWIARPNPIIVDRYQINPLPKERWMSEQDIERRFLAALKKSDFLYVHCPGGYVGLSTGLEVGYANGR